MASSGNFAVFSTITRPESSYSTSDQITGGGLSIKPPGSGSFEPVIATISPNSGKWYWEYRAGQGGGSSYGRPAIATSEQTVVKNEDLTGGQSGQVGVLFQANDGQKRIGGSQTSYGNAVSQHDIVQVALDCDNGAVYFGINNTWQNSGNPASGASKTGAALSTGIQNVDIDILHTRYVGGGVDQYNFGQDDTFDGAITGEGNADGNGHGVFKYSPPSGYLSLCSANLPISDDIDPAQTDDNYPQKLFGAEAFTGNGGTQTIQLGDGFQPDCVWLKNRGTSNSWIALDSSRGYNKTLKLETGDAEGTNSYVGYGIESNFFGSTGIVANSGGSPGFNNSTHNYIVYGWRANGGTTSTNTDGTITSTVQVNQAAGFSIMQWVGTGGTNGQTIGHGLGAVPDIWIVKDRDQSSRDWQIGLNTTAGSGFARLSGANDQLELNDTGAAAQMWRPEGNFTATATTCNTPNNGNSNPFFNTSTNNFIAYLWRSIEGFSKFGLFEGNSNADGPFIYTGFRPRFVFCKSIDATENWQLRDTARHTNTGSVTRLYFNSNAAEGTASTASPIDFLANGFKVRGNNSEINTNTIAYGAWGDIPFKYNNTQGDTF